MPLKNGELNASELRRLVREHNKLVSLKIPKGTNRDGLIKLIKSQGYEIDHKRQRLFPIRVQSNKKYPPVVNLPPAPAKKTAEEKAEAKKQKRMKAEKKEEEAFESRKKKIEALKKARMKLKEKQKQKPKPKQTKKSPEVFKDNIPSPPPKKKLTEAEIKKLEAKNKRKK